MTRAEVIVILGLPPDANCVWPECGCTEDADDPGCGGTGEADRCLGPSHPKLCGLKPREHHQPSRNCGPGDDDYDLDGEWVQDAPCRCPCHGGAS